MAFLLTHVAFFAYAVFVMTSIILGQVKDENLFDVVFKDTSTGQEYNADFWTVAQYIFVKNIYLGMLNIFAAIMDIVLLGFFCYHLYLVSIGQTTNESFKWASIKQVQSKLVSAHKKFLKQEMKDEISKKVTDSSLTGAANILESAEKTAEEVKTLHNAVDAAAESEGVTVIEHAQKDVNDSDGSDDAMGDGYVCVASLSAPKGAKELIKKSVPEVSAVPSVSITEASEPSADEVKPLPHVEDKVSHVSSTPTRHPIRSFIEGTYRLPDVLEDVPMPLPANIYNKGLFKGLW